MRVVFFSITALLLWCPIRSAGAVEWFESGPSGIIGEPVDEGPGILDWRLSIVRENETEERRLYSGGELYSSVTLSRSGGQLLFWEERDADGGLTSRVEYSYDAEGNPRASYIDSADSAPRVEFEGGIHPDMTVRRHQSGAGGSWVITDFDAGGYPARWVSIENGEVVSEALWTRTEEGLPVESRMRDGKDIRTSLYDGQGRLVSEQTRRDGFLVFTRTYSWAGDDLVRVEERGEGRLWVRKIEWDGERIAREVRLVDGLTESEIEWTSSDQRIETRCRGGKAVIRSYWAGETLQKEEFLRDGKVVRVQTRDSAAEDR